MRTTKTQWEDEKPGQCTPTATLTEATKNIWDNLSVTQIHVVKSIDPTLDTFTHTFLFFK